MSMMTTNRQEIESEYILFIFLKGMEIAFRKPNGFFCLPYKWYYHLVVMPVKPWLCSRKRLPSDSPQMENTKHSQLGS
jgi:hypothetical protein